MGGGQLKNDSDGYPSDGVFYAADAQKLQTFNDANRELSHLQAPALLHDANPHERLYVACFDGTGNDKYQDPGHATNVAKISDQLKALGNSKDSCIQPGYVPGPGTQNGAIARTLDGITGHTYDQRTEEMYQQFITQAKQWRQDDPKADIRIAEIGFSRGADQVPGFARLVEERGIQDPAGAKYTRDAHGQITHVDYTRPPLVPPGQTAQAVGLFDPVGTGDPVKYHDRRLPPSVISGFQITAEDERRGLFKSDRIIKPGQSPDGRFLAVNVAGAHSDIGGSYLLDGLAIRSDNLMIDYLNALSDKPFLKKSAEPTDPSRNVIHRSEQSNFLYKFYPKINRNTPDGYNDLLVPKSQIGKVGDAYHAEPRNELLSQHFERQFVKIGALPSQEHLSAAPTSHLSAQVDGLLAAGNSGDQAALRTGTQTLANSDAARAMQSEAEATVNRQEHAQALLQSQAPLSAQEAAPPQQNPALSGPPQR